MTNYTLVDANIKYMTRGEMVALGFTSAISGWYLTAKRGECRGYLRIGLNSVDHIPSALPRQYDPRTGEHFDTRIRSRRARR